MENNKRPEKEITITLFGEELTIKGIEKAKKALRQLGFKFKNNNFATDVEGDVRCSYRTPEGKKHTSVHFVNANYKPVNTRERKYREIETQIETIKNQAHSLIKELRIQQLRLFED